VIVHRGRLAASGETVDNPCPCCELASGNRAGSGPECVAEFAEAAVTGWCGPPERGEVRREIVTSGTEGWGRRTASSRGASGDRRRCRCRQGALYAELPDLPPGEPAGDSAADPIPGRCCSEGRNSQNTSDRHERRSNSEAADAVLRQQVLCGGHRQHHRVSKDQALGKV